jgi:hypothetical protein
MPAGNRDGVPETGLGLSHVGFGQRQQQLALKPVQLRLDPPTPAPRNSAQGIGQKAEAGCSLPRPPVRLGVQSQEIGQPELGRPARPFSWHTAQTGRGRSY